MSGREHTLKEYELTLKEKVSKKELKCPRCGNEEEFMVNELGHVFCKKCHEKMRFVRLDTKK